jgi:hypothetical protein
MTDWADRPGDDFVQNVDVKDESQRQEWALRGSFADFDEARGIASTLDPPRYVALGPRGGFSIFKMHELPWGDVEGDSAQAWPLEEVVVFLPPGYVPEPATVAFAGRRRFLR